MKIKEKHMIDSCTVNQKLFNVCETILYQNCENGFKVK